MFLGHLAVGFASKRVAPRASLGPLMAAPILLDLIFPVFALAGIENFHIAPGNTAVMPLAFDSYPWSHSLAMSVVWAILFGGGYYAVTRYGAGAAVIGAGVVSHWVLDVVTHRPDMPLFPGTASPLLGLGLWDSIPATMAVEGAMFATGLALYAAMTRARDAIGRWALAAFVVLVTLIYMTNIFGPPPTSTRAVAVIGLAAWLLPLWAGWADAHRDVTLRQTSG